MEHLGAEAREFQHFLEGHDGEPPRVVDDARVRRVDAIHVGVDAAFVDPNRRGDSHGRRVGPAPTEGGHVAVGIDALESRDDRRDAGVQIGVERLDVDVLDTRPRVRRVRTDPHLRAQVRLRRVAPLDEGHRQQRDRHLFARCQQHVALSRRRAFDHVAGKPFQPVGLAAHGRDHHHHAVTVPQRAGDTIRDRADAFRAPEGGASVLVYVPHGDRSGQADRASTQPGRDARASPRASGRSPPPARAMSGRPPPRAPTCAPT